YHFADGRLVLASELGSIVRSMHKRPPLNRGFLAEIASAQHHSRTDTAYQSIHRLTAAHGLLCNGDSVRTQRYWTLPLDVTVRHKNDADYSANYLSVLSDCLAGASRTEAPLAMDVSGGLDSSALYALAHHLAGKDELRASEIRGYTLAGVAGSAADEVQFARDTAVHVAGSLTEVPLFEPSLDWFAEQSCKAGDFATYTNGAMSLAMERAAVCDGCRVSIGGNGGDQWLDGIGLAAYQSYRALDGRGLAAGLGTAARQSGATSAVRIAMRDFVRAVLPPSLRREFRLRREAASNQEPAFWLAPDLREALRDKRADHARTQAAEPLARLKQEKLENAQFQWAIELAERQMAREGLESRSPMLARAFIEFSAATPEHIRRRGTQTKYIHRLAMQDILPRSVIERTHEASFPETMGVKSELLTFLDGLLDETQLFDPAGLAQLSARYKAAEVDGEWAWAVWGCFVSASLLAQSTTQ
ncbi:MAG: asparagine synthase C-terminal domain-containing protein, partial [Marinomonas sp.]